MGPTCLKVMKTVAIRNRLVVQRAADGFHGPLENTINYIISESCVHISAKAHKISQTADNETSTAQK